MIYAGDVDAGEPPHLTWKMALDAIELVRYCTVEKGVYLEIEAGIFEADVMVGVTEVKLVRRLEGTLGDE